jgi:hypothetical protein
MKSKRHKNRKKKKNQGEIAFLDLRHPAELQSRLVSACERVISSGIYVHGPDVALFEAEWATYCKTDHAPSASRAGKCDTGVRRNPFRNASGAARHSSGMISC